MQKSSFRPLSKTALKQTQIIKINQTMEKTEIGFCIMAQMSKTATPDNLDEIQKVMFFKFLGLQVSCLIYSFESPIMNL
jgi:hypothetical protein